MDLFKGSVQLPVLMVQLSLLLNQREFMMKHILKKLSVTACLLIFNILCCFIVLCSSALRAFKRRVAYANASYDRIL